MQISAANLLIAAQQGARPGGAAQPTKSANPLQPAVNAQKTISEFEPIAFRAASILPATVVPAQALAQPKSAGSLVDIIA